MKSLKIQALAKINLDLRVLQKRADGFHELRTVFQTISMSDSIRIEYEKARVTELSMDGNVEIPDNLILRAARAVLDATGTNAWVRFVLEKKIPMGGGLGGGSSDAAAVLLALPVLIGKRAEIRGIAADLGSDVPFFLDGGTALGVGRGTELYPLPDVVEEPILLATPGVHVSTAEAYAALNRALTFTGSSTKINDFREFVCTLGEGRRASQASAFSENDFEAVVFRQHPKLKTIARKLWKSGAEGVRMTGSGSAIFGLFGSVEARDRAREDFGGDSIAARLVSRRAYRSLWRRQLREHIAAGDDLWPPRSRYER